MNQEQNVKKAQKSALFVVTLAIFTDMLLYGMIVPILPDYAETLRLPQTAIGILFGSYAAALLIATPIFGVISDKVGRSRPMLWGIIGLVAATLLFAFATSFWLLLICRILQGIAAAATWTAGLALLADFYPSKERGKVMGIALSGQAMGILLGPTFGGWLYQLGGYMLPFFVAAGIAFIDGLLRVFLLKEEPHQQEEESSGALALLKNRTLLMIVGAVVIGAAIPSVLEPTFPTHLQNVFDASPGIIGLLFGVPSLAYAFAAPIVGSVSTKIGHPKTITIGLGITAISLVLVVMPTTMWLQVAALALIGISMGTVLAPTLPELADIAQENQTQAYGVTFAIYNTAYSIGMMLGPISSGTFADIFGLQASYFAIGIIVLVYMLFFAVMTRLKKKPT
ncbi:MFS transporter [Virgibacillus sp. NKC19-3]|uniref:MFS transporter n=1 Tax=Virgibacillus saliphilus TaxID=2831674 RepID=UPI001C9ACE8A|nr:MFS transporter [Virgibacillus sp. NKC19-3]MBY7141963.1 MFS transporter [Virgibacillus sp. NKC19-3]